MTEGVQGPLRGVDASSASPHAATASSTVHRILDAKTPGTLGQRPGALPIDALGPVRAGWPRNPDDRNDPREM